MWLIVLGLVMLVAGVILKAVDREKEIYEGHATARVGELVRRDGDGRYRSRYYPVLEYYAEGMLYKVVYPSGAYPARWEVGKELNILYEPADPEKYCIVENSVRLVLPQILQTAGIAFLLLGVVSFIRFASRA